jgi:hypothetical protein
VKELRTEIDIAAAPERVWQVLTDFENYPAWNPFITKVEGKAKVGERVKIHIKMPNRALTLQCTVLELAPVQKMRWKWCIFWDRIYCGEHSVQIEPQGEGRVHIDHREVFNGILLPFFKKQIDTQTRQGFESMDQSLKAHAEKVA